MHIKTKEKKRVINDMADAMLRYGDGCTKEQLLLQFTQEEVDAYSSEARALANTMSVREAA